MNKELKASNLLSNPKYDFNYQYVIDMEPTKLNKGDAIVLECFYSSMNAKNMTFWGFSTSDEMCNVYFYYYPRIEPLKYCHSIESKESMYDFYKSLQKDSLIDTNIEFDVKKYEENIEPIRELFTRTQFNDELRKRFTDYFRNPGEVESVCGVT